MSSDSFPLSSNVFGFIMGGITLLGLLINICRFHLPSNKIKVLESLLDETETFFRKAIEDGVLIEPNFVRETEQHLEILKRRTYSLQASAYNATTLTKDYSEFFGGTSTAIGAACQSLRKLRAVVISSSEEGRRRLMEMNSTSQAAPSILPPNPVPQVENHPTLPATEITRPRSCPPSISMWSFDDTKSAAAPENPFNDPTSIESYIHTADAQLCTPAVHTSTDLELEA